MVRVTRWVVVGVVMLATSLIFNFTPLAARWVRLGDSQLVVDGGPNCANGVWVSAAYSAYKPDGQPIANTIGTTVSIYNFATLTIPDLPVLQEGRSFPRGSATMGVDYIHLVSTDVATPFHEKRIYFENPGGISKGNIPNVVLEDYANYYGSSFVTWPETIDFTKYPYIVIMSTDGYVAHISKGFEDCTELHPTFTDGRVNSYDTSASAAIYCQNDGVTVYGIDAQGKGYFAFSVSASTIKSLGKPLQNTRLATKVSVFGGNIELYLLPSGKLQLNAPGLPPVTSKTYIYTWDGCNGNNTPTNGNPGTPITPSGGSITHTVQRGEFLYGIAQHYGVSVSALAAANNIINVNLISVGQKLVIPSGPPPANSGSSGGTIHVVQAGENLFRIALRYGVSVNDLAVVNNIGEVRHIFIGQRLIIPPKSA